MDAYDSQASHSHSFSTDCNHSSKHVHLPPLSKSSTERGAQYDGEVVLPASGQLKKRARRRVFKETGHPVYQGVRRRSKNKPVSELQGPNKKARKCPGTGTYPTADMVAQAEDNGMENGLPRPPKMNVIIFPEIRTVISEDQYKNGGGGADEELFNIARWTEVPLLSPPPSRSGHRSINWDDCYEAELGHEVDIPLWSYSM